MTDTLLHKNPSTGHEGHEVHICHRCGWPFPNSHPSARHRRAHKRVCGTIEGYALTQPKSDDDDDDSDENEHAPSVVVEKTDSKEVGSGVGVGMTASKSEDDMFSDAITEFSDGGNGVSPQAVDKIVENKTVDETVDKTQVFNGSTSIDLKSASGATVDANVGITPIADPKAEPVPVEQYNESQPDLVKSEILKDVAISVEQCNESQPDLVKSDILTDAAVSVEQNDESQSGLVKSEILSEVPVDTNLQGAEGKLVSVSVDSDEGKTSDHATEVVKHDPSILTATLKEMDTVKDVDFVDKSADVKPLECVGENGGKDSSTAQEKIDSAMQLAPSTDSPCDFNSDAKPLEKVSKSESSLPESRDDDSKKPSEELDTEQTCDIPVESDVKQVESIYIAETAKESAPLIVGSEISIGSCISEINGTSTKVSTGVNPEGNVAPSTKHLEDPALSVQEPSLLNQKSSKETPSSVEGHTSEDASCAEPVSHNKIAESENFSFTSVVDKGLPPPSISATGGDNGEVASVHLKSLHDESDVKVTKENGGISAADPSNYSSATSDSMEVNCGSVSETGFQEAKTTSEKRDSKKSDDFEAPSFMSLVQFGEDAEKARAASEIETVQSNLELKSDALQAAWFPSLTNVVNESDSRKKNEEKIAKVTNWSPGRQHGPLKNLLNDAKSPKSTQIPATDKKDEETGKDNGDVATKEKCAVDTEAGKEMDKEWDSPARYPIEAKKEKKKKSYWIPFACCSSVHRDL